jgi:hypothetical protein
LDGVCAFAAGSAYERVQLLRDHRHQRQWPEEADEAVKRIEVVPPHAVAFRLSDNEIKLCKAASERARLDKNNELRIVEGASDILDHVCTLLDAFVRTPSYAGVALLGVCLMLVSGRRLAEIMNGRSTFVADGMRHVVFSGQLKKRGHDITLRIPLLTPADTFIVAVAVLRQRQGDVTSLTNEQVTRRYQTNLTRELRCLYPALHHVHVLRSVYISAVVEAFVSPHTFARTAMLCLGHATLAESLAYNNVSLRDFERHRDRYGALGAVGEVVHTLRPEAHVEHNTRLGPEST